MQQQESPETIDLAKQAENWEFVRIPAIARTYCTVPNSPGLASPSLPGDVGHNLSHPLGEQFVVPAGQFRQIKTGIHVEFPEGYWGLIVARSGANFTGRLVVLPGVIDQGYRGELTAMVHNVAQRTWQDRVTNYIHRVSRGRFGRSWSTNDVVLPAGKSVAQLVFFRIELPAIMRVYGPDGFSYANTARGHNGYGSTDQNGNGHLTGE